MTNPPTPPDIHAIQTYFFDPDGKEWIATVLAPRGRDLASQWHGAYKVPDRPTPATAGAKKSPAPLFAIVLVVLIVGGGAAAVVAGTQNTPNASPAAPTSAPEVSVVPTAPVAVSAEPTAPPAATTAPTQRPGGTPVPTQPPVVRTPAPTAPPPPPGGTSVTLADGSVVTYSGPARVNIGSAFVVTFTVRNANNTPGTGTFLVSFGNQSTGGAKTSSGTLNPNGQFTVNYPGQSLPGNYPFLVNYKGVQGQVAIIRVG